MDRITDDDARDLLNEQIKELTAENDSLRQQLEAERKARELWKALSSAFSSEQWPHTPTIEKHRAKYGREK